MTKERYFLTSVTRNSDLDSVPFDVDLLPRSRWAAGDFVVGEVLTTPRYETELDSGRMILNMKGDLLVGAFGKRSATLEGVGDWEQIDTDLRMQSLTGAGLFGKATSKSPFMPDWLELRYRGHVIRDDGKITMMQFARAGGDAKLQIPVILVVGTSMSAGKTTTGRIMIHELTRAGLRVGGAKLTGASRYRDILSFLDAGAAAVFDFVDVGLPSTVCSADQYRECLRQLLGVIAGYQLDVLVAEAGASPLEPYNGEIAIRELGERIRCTVLCASDPYAVVGVKMAFNLRPDLVAGPATATAAATALVRRLSGLYALDLTDRANMSPLRRLLADRLGLAVPV
jgi:hypothetical protein